MILNYDESFIGVGEGEVKEIKNTEKNIFTC